MRQRTQKEINQEIKNLENQIDDTRNLRKHRPEIVELERKIEAIRASYREETETSIACWKSDIEQLKKELKNKKEDNQIQLSEKVKKWFRNYLSGVSFGYKDPKIIWISPDERFVIITSPGGTAGTGTPMGTGGYYYAASTHWITEIVEGKSYLDFGEVKLLEHEGRLSKEIKEKMITLAEQKANCIYRTKNK